MHSALLIIQKYSGFSGPEKRRSSASTLPNYCRNKDAYSGVAKDLQKLTVAEYQKCWTKERTSNCHTSWRTAWAWIWGCSSVLLWLCRAVCQDGHVTSGDTWVHHSTILEGAMKVQADNELVEEGSQNSDAAWSWWLLETQLTRPQINPETVSPWEKEWSSGRCTILSLHFLIFMHGPWIYLYSLTILPPLLKIPPDSQRQKTGTAFWSSWFVSTACTGSQRWKEERKDCEQPRNVPRCMLLAGQAIAF